MDQSMLMRGPSPFGAIKKTVSNSVSLWPPLKSSRYCKKQRQRSLKSRAFSPSIMLMHESSINHNRVSNALNELSNGSSSSSCLFERIPTPTNRPFWRKSTCHEFWDDYLECEDEFSRATHDFSMLSINNNSILDESCPRVCYSKITKSIRKLLKRTFTGASTFSELEDLIKSLSVEPFSSSMPNSFNFSCGQILNLSEFGATVQLDTPFHRVWLHAICQYHGLTSQSKTVVDKRLVFVNFRSKRSKPKINLYNFLLEF